MAFPVPPALKDISLPLPHARTLLHDAENFLEAGDPEKALSGYKSALVRLQDIYGATPQKVVIRCLGGLGATLEKPDRLQDAFTVYQERLVMHRNLYGPTPQYDHAHYVQDIGAILRKLGKLAEALVLYEEALEMHRELSRSNDTPDLLHALSIAGAVLTDMGNYPKALTYLNEAHAIGTRLLLSREDREQAQLLLTSILSNQKEALGKLKRVE